MGKTKKPTAEVRELDIGQSVLAPIDHLLVSPHNVRKTDINDVTGLKASILEHGLLEALVGYRVPDEVSTDFTDGQPVYYIAAGQRRLIALEQLVADGAIAANAPVPVRLVDECTAIEVSLAENIERKAMNPADETAAFKALVDTGSHDATTIAKRFGFRLDMVKRRLKMAVLAEPIMNALREGTITLDAAEAYAATCDQDLQLTIYKGQCASNWQPHSRSSILSAIASAGISADSVVGTFIGGAKAYAKAGGALAIDEDFLDLFANIASEPKEMRFTDPNLVLTLFNAKCAGLEKKMLAEAKKVFPFIDAIEWFVPSQHGLARPKIDKKQGLVLVETNRWDSPVKTLAELKKVAAKAVDKQGARAVAFVSLTGTRDDKGKLTVEPYVIETELLVGKDGWEKSLPKKKDEERTKHPSDMTPEERAQYVAEQKAAQREEAIRNRQELLWARSLIGPTPGFVVTDVTITGRGELQLRMVATDEDHRIVSYADQSDAGTYSGWNRTVKAELLAPFREEAEARQAEREKEQEIRQREAEAKEKELVAERIAALERFNDKYNVVLDETVPPEVLILTDNEADDFEIEFVNQGEGWVHTDDDGDEETVTEFDTVMNLIADYAEHRTEQPRLVTFATFGEFEAHLAAKGDVDQVDAELQVDARVEETAEG